MNTHTFPIMKFVDITHDVETVTGIQAVKELVEFGRGTQAMLSVTFNREGYLVIEDAVATNRYLLIKEMPDNQGCQQLMRFLRLVQLQYEPLSKRTRDTFFLPCATFRGNDDLAIKLAVIDTFQLNTDSSFDHLVGRVPLDELLWAASENELEDPVVTSQEIDVGPVDDLENDFNGNPVSRERLATAAA